MSVYTLGMSQVSASLFVQVCLCKSVCDLHSLFVQYTVDKVADS